MKHTLCRILLLSVILLAGCSRKDRGGEPGEGGVDMNIRSLDLTGMEQEYLKGLRQNGCLRVAAVRFPGAYEIDESGVKRGFHYRMILALCEALDMPGTV